MNKINKTAVCMLLGCVFSFNLQAETLYPLPIPETGPLNTITVTPANSSMKVGETKQYQASGTFMDSSTRNLSTSASRVATTPLPSTNLFSSATLLPDGKVLVAGVWQDKTTVIPPSFLYDPATNTFTQTGSMHEPRSYYGATLLKNGKILVVGSYEVANGFSGTAELYDPNLYDPNTGLQGTWSYTTGATKIARSSATATLLSSGKVLITGGFTGPTEGWVTNKAEIYDPDAYDSFSLTTNPMSIQRAWHTATRLKNGEVLVVGGNINSAQTNTAEIYNPDTGEFRPTTNNMAVARQYHTATLLKNGKVLISGGQSWPTGYVTEDEIYDPDFATFSKTGTTSPPKDEGFTATLLGNGKVFLPGKLANDDTIYDPDSNTMSSAGTVYSSSTTQTAGAPLLKNGKIFQLTVEETGGYKTPGAYIFTPADVAWSSGNLSVATIDMNGIATGVAFTTSTNPASMIASSGTINSSTALTVYSQPPTSVTNSVTNILQTTATLNSTVNTNGDSGGIYGVCTSSTETLNFMNVTLLTSPVNGLVSLNLTGLKSNVTYNCHMNAWGNHTNVDDTIGAPDITFTTLPYPPVATTKPATLVKTNSATLNGTCDLKGGLGSAWFTYWKTAKPSVTMTTPSQSLSASPSPVPVSAAITLLTKGTSYAYKLTCTNNGGSNTGSSVSFNTPSR